MASIFYRLQLGQLLDGKPLMLVAVNPSDQTRFEGPMLDVDAGLMEEPPPSAPVRHSDVQNMLTASYFNANLAQYVRLPAAQALYSVHVEYGGTRSNAVQIEVLKR